MPSSRKYNILFEFHADSWNFSQGNNPFPQTKQEQNNDKT